MSDFSPGVASASAGGVKINVQPYKDTNQSLLEVCKKIVEGRNDPAVRGWAGDVLLAAGDPKTNVAKAQALLDAFRAQTTYQPDPTNSEMLVSAAGTLCLRPGLCVRARDCDDGCIAVGAACASVAIPIAVVHAVFGAGKQEHVLLAVEDERGNLYEVDPSSSFDVGVTTPGTKTMMDPFDPKLGFASASGDFVGVGAPAEIVDGDMWISTPDNRWRGLGVGLNAPIQFDDGRWLIENDGHMWVSTEEGGWRGLGSGLVTPGDVLAYRQLWDPYVKAVAAACVNCAAAWNAAAAGQSPNTPINTSQFATPPTPQTETLWAQSQQGNYDSIDAQWNAYAGSSDYEIVLGASEMLLFYQKTILQIGQYYVPQLQRDCPGIVLPEPPTSSAQAYVIGQIEGLGILAHGALQLLGIGAGGALETLGAAASTAKHVVDKAADAIGSPFFWLAVTVVGGAILIPPVISAIKAHRGR